jgi:phage tail protein X
MKNLHDFWTLPASEQNAIREANPGYADTEEDYQAFLNALFPAMTFEEADELYHLSDDHVEGEAK